MTSSNMFLEPDEPRVALAQFPAIAASVTERARHAGYAKYSTEFDRALGRHGAAQVGLHQAPTFDPDERRTDMWLVRDAEQARAQHKDAKDKVSAAEERLAAAELRLARLPLGLTLGRRLGLYLALLVMAIGATLAASALFAASLHMALVDPYLFQAYGDVSLAGPISAICGLLVAGLLSFAFPIAVVGTGGRTSWPFKLIVLLAELGFAAALGFLRHGSSDGWLEVVAISSIEGAIIVVVSFVSLVIGARLRMLAERTEAIKAAEAEVGVLEEHLSQSQSRLGVLAQECQKLRQQVFGREDAERLGQASIELARSTASVAYATEVSAMVHERSQHPGEVTLGKILGAALDAEKHINIAGRLQ